jgi:hypothetical protein
MISKHTRTRLIWDGGKKRRAHRVIMERIIGRPLRADEHVHHKDKNPLNNDPSNLELMTKATHERLHGDERQLYSDGKACVVCGKPFKANPRKRKRQKCCSHECAQSMRIAGRKAQVAAEFIRSACHG